MEKIYYAVLIVFLNMAVPVAATAAESSVCEIIIDAAERLECYDQQAKLVPATMEDVSDQYAESPLRRRIRQEEKVSLLGDFVIVPHRPTYLMPVTYVDDINLDPWLAFGVNDEQIDNWEAKYQISFKVPLWLDIAGNKVSLWFGYTQLSLWQLYNAQASSPFRETNYEPEIMLAVDTDMKLFGMNNTVVVFGINHQSNGQPEPLSRSWNRLYVNFVLESKNLVMFIKPWYRLPEDAEDDDNPDIDEYLGYGEVSLFYKQAERITGVRLWNNFSSSDNHTTVQLDWNFPIGSGIKGYIQYFNGYGETLVDYDYRSKRIGFGIMLTDWF